MIKMRINSVARNMGCTSRRECYVGAKGRLGLGLRARCIVLVLGRLLKVFFCCKACVWWVLTSLLI